MEYKLICKHCGKEFYHKTYQKVYCNECSALGRKKRGGKASLKKMATKSISQVVRELEKYNKEHGTCISYGQYVSMNC